MSGMRTDSQAGYVSGLLVSLIGVIVLLLAALGFGAWAFSSRQDYKNNSDKKAAAAVVKAKEATQKEDAAQYAEQAKSPLKNHVGPDAFGAVSIVYPKTWSAYVIENNTNGGVPMNDYFQPDIVPNIANPDNAYALRVQILQQAYNAVLAGYNGLVQSKKVTVSPYALPKVPSVIGSRIDGQISNQKQGSVVVLPLRNLTLVVSTESTAFQKDFDDIILPNLSFSP